MSPDDNAEDAAFWERVSTMPYVEAEAELRRRRTAAIERRHQAQRKGADCSRDDLLIARLNEEIHLICEARTRANLKRAMREVLPPEQYEAVIVRLAMMDPRAT